MDKFKEGTEHEEMEDTKKLGVREALGAPGAARQTVASATEEGAAGRPGGATQNSGGALQSNEDEDPDGLDEGAK